ncbi:MAG: hypothetical protein LH468_03545 [Nocardioides sp.]|nr:hypothetical protein [Nocardioides sp.]
MTRSSESATSRPWYTSRPAVVFTATATGLIAAAAAYTAVTRAEDRTGMGFLVAFMGSVSVMMLLGLGSGAARWSVADLEGRPAWRLRLGPAQPVPVVALVLTGMGLGLVWAAVTLASDAEGGSIGVVVLLSAVAVFLLVLAVQLWLTWVRAPSLWISADHLRYDGAGIVVDLAWDDVGTVEHADRTSRWACVKVTAAVGAPSYRHRKRALPLPADRVPDPAGVELRHGLLPDVAGMLGLLRELHVGGRATRESVIARGVPEASGR